MEMRYGMPVWAPDDIELAAIAKRVARERSKAAVDAIQSAKGLFVNEHEVRGDTRTGR